MFPSLSDRFSNRSRDLKGNDSGCNQALNEQKEEREAHKDRIIHKERNGDGKENKIKADQEEDEEWKEDSLFMIEWGLKTDTSIGSVPHPSDNNTLIKTRAAIITSSSSSYFSNLPSPLIPKFLPDFLLHFDIPPHCQNQKFPFKCRLSIHSNWIKLNEKPSHNMSHQSTIKTENVMN